MEHLAEFGTSLFFFLSFYIEPQESINSVVVDGFRTHKQNNVA
jgi:hypothetical protein